MVAVIIIVSITFKLLIDRYGYDLLGKPSRSALTKAYDVFQNLSKCKGPAQPPGMSLVPFFCKHFTTDSSR